MVNLHKFQRGFYLVALRFLHKIKEIVIVQIGVCLSRNKVLLTGFNLSFSLQKLNITFL